MIIFLIVEKHETRLIPFSYEGMRLRDPGLKWCKEIPPFSYIEFGERMCITSNLKSITIFYDTQMDKLIVEDYLLKEFGKYQGFDKVEINTISQVRE